MSENLILEHVRAIRSDIADIKVDVREVKHRLTTLEIALGNPAATEANDYASLSSRMEWLEDRTERVKRRLEIA
jgi:predicted  nucleic acid-binding Zn-ribbon protein